MSSIDIKSSALSLIFMVIILLAATALRAQDIALTRDMLHYDEAYYGVDALSLLAEPRLTAFFPDNFGRESLWMYVLTPALAVFGANSFALRITALFVGVLTVAAVYRLGRVLYGWRAGVWSAAVLAVLFWHVLASHQAFRALLYPLVGALAFAALWETLFVGATRRVAPTTRASGVGAQYIAPLHSHAYAAAFWFGILAYTYIAARTWIVLAAVMVGVAVIRTWRMSIGATRRVAPTAREGDLTDNHVWSPAHWAQNTAPLRTFVVAVIVFAIIVSPLVLTFIANPALANLRSEQIAISSIAQLVENLRAWAGAWFLRGSEDVAYNLPGRPILDLPLALVLIMGGAAWVGRVARCFIERNSDAPLDVPTIGDGGSDAADAMNGVPTRNGLVRTTHDARRTGLARHAPTILVIALLAASLAPAVLTTGTLKPLRAIGSVVPLALLLGATAMTTTMRHAQHVAPLRRRFSHVAPLQTWIVVGLLALAALNTSRDFAAWVRSPDLFLAMEQHVMRGIDWVAAQDSADPIYFSPFTPDHPVIRFRAGDLAPRPVSAFKADECLRLAEGGADYFALTLFDPGFADRLRPYANVREAMREGADPPRYAVYHGEPEMSMFSERRAVWNDQWGVARLDGVPDAAAPGEAINLVFGLRVMDPSSASFLFDGRHEWRPYGIADVRTPFMTSAAPPQSIPGSGRNADLPPLTLFIHLYGDPTPYEGGVLWAQTDMPLCPSSPPATWRADEVIVQATTLTLPPDLPAARYRIALGMYDSRTGARLPVTTPENGLDYAIVAEIEVGS